MSERVEVDARRCAELVALGLSIAQERLEAVRQRIIDTGAEHVAAGRWAEAEELTHWGACTDHALQQVRNATNRGTIARLAAQIADAHTTAGEDEAAREWRTIADALKEGCDDGE